MASTDADFTKQQRSAWPGTNYVWIMWAQVKRRAGTEQEMIEKSGIGGDEEVVIARERKKLDRRWDPMGANRKVQSELVSPATGHWDKSWLMLEYFLIGDEIAIVALAKSNLHPKTAKPIGFMGIPLTESRP